MIYSHDIIKKRILVTGATGLLGGHVLHYFKDRKNIQLLACSIEDSASLDGIDYVKCDITNRDEVKKVAYDFYPDFIINAAAYTNVNLSEVEREKAWKLNVHAVEYLAEVCRVLDAQLIHISSDYIFDGKNGPYSEIDKPNPVSYYGRTKLASENALKISGAIHTILRANVLYGTTGTGKKDFVTWLVENLMKNQQVRIVIDQVNNPTYAEDLVELMGKIILYQKHGIYNVGGLKFLSRYDFAIMIADVFKLDPSLITPIKTEELNQAALRPLKSGLVTLKAEAELGYRPHELIETLFIIKRQLSL
ncbi:MAG: dTDP-4-dehydrorhamnose reductase [Syntrophothermus sp.]